jgi:hypothetical protein
MHRLNPGMLVLGIAIILVAVLAGSFIHPVLFLIGLSVIIVYFIGGEA